MTMPVIWFWQLIVSPHMAGLAVALAALGCDVTYVAASEMSGERALQGWESPPMHGVHLVLIKSKAEAEVLLDRADPRAIHICQGLRGNGYISKVQRAIARRCFRQVIVMETVDDSGALGGLKRIEYSRLVACRATATEAMLTIGHEACDWVVKRGVPRERAFPFAYFIPRPTPPVEGGTRLGVSKAFRFIFVGQLVEGKRVGLLVDALSKVSKHAFELSIVGAGPLESKLHAQIDRLPALAGKVHWLGRRAIGDVPIEIAAADCLVLPSRHDGWGVVVSEALLVGTPAICSDACGSAGVVLASGAGGVFRSESPAELSVLLERALSLGRVTQQRRSEVAEWASCLTSQAGAEYLLQVIAYTEGAGCRPSSPWAQTRANSAERIRAN